MSPQNTVVDAAAWHEASLMQMAEEKAFTHQREALSAKRRAMPWLEITKEYRFSGPDGEVTLGDLFAGRSQLALYHFMMGPGWGEGCPSCSFWADNYDGVGIHLGARDTTLVAVSRGPLDQLEAYKARMGWNFPWYSSAASSFNFDMGVSFTAESIADGTARYNHASTPPHGEEMPGLSVFTQADGGKIYLTYQTFSRGLDAFNTAYQLLDLTPKGRDESGLPFTMAWLRRHDSYE